MHKHTHTQIKRGRRRRASKRWCVNFVYQCRHILYNIGKIDKSGVLGNRKIKNYDNEQMDEIEATTTTIHTPKHINRIAYSVVETAVNYTEDGEEEKKHTQQLMRAH